MQHQDAVSHSYPDSQNKEQVSTVVLQFHGKAPHQNNNCSPGSQHSASVQPSDSSMAHTTSGNTVSVDVLHT